MDSHHSSMESFWRSENNNNNNKFIYIYSMKKEKVMEENV
jgi:hypothetical protein